MQAGPDGDPPKGIPRRPPAAGPDHRPPAAPAATVRAGRRPPAKASALTAARTMPASQSGTPTHRNDLQPTARKCKPCPETPANGVPRHQTAELVRPYLNPSWQRFRFRLEEQLADIACHPHMNPDGPRIPQRRGTPAFDWIVAEYVAGASSTALASVALGK
jgi:hypothetical protein